MKPYSKFLLLSFCCSFLFVQVAAAQVGNVDREAKVKPKLMILGTYHMATTTRNVINKEVDDVTSPTRQKQIAELLEKLKKFNPTKIAVEVDVDKDADFQDRYTKYLAGNFEITRNEIYQLGFRLAQMLGHKKVYCVDSGVESCDPLYNYMEYASKHPELKKFLDEAFEKLSKDVNEETAKLRMLPVTDQLILLNQPERMEADHQLYFDIMRIGKGEEYSGVAWLTWWYGRNMRILVNVIRDIESPDDRILIIFGAGHGKLLNQLAEESGFFEVVSPLEYLEK